MQTENLQDFYIVLCSAYGTAMLCNLNIFQFKLKTLFIAITGGFSI